MKLFNKRPFQEDFLYLVLWIIVFMTPVMGYAFLSNENQPFDWSNVFFLWNGLLPFLGLFILNNYLLVPFLLFKKKYTLYGASVILVIIILFQFRPQPIPLQMRNMRLEKMRTEHPDFPGRKPERVKPEIPEEKWRKPPKNIEWNDLSFPGPDFQRQFVPFPLHILFIHITLNILLIGFNIAIKLFFRSIQNEKKLRELESHNLQTELNYLKYQINPHFFMNTLNNIHALVDMDTAKAKKSIIELSKMMRYLLYDSNQKSISLEQEIQFLSNYIQLMRLRYTEKVQIECVLPETIPTIYLPPLLFISYIENSFKHGISYRKKSYISISLQIQEDKLVFKCINSNWGKSDSESTGIGLQNTSKRLKLIYGDDYQLSIQSTYEKFDVSLIIPLKL